MEHESHPVGHVEPSGAQVREHWSMWQRFTSASFKGIIVVAIIVVIAVFFITR